MLSPADAELVSRDRALPGLGTLLDPEAFARALRGAAPALALSAATPTYLRYKPGTNCLVAYRLEVSGPEASSGEVLVYAKAYGAGAGGKLTKEKWAGKVGAGGLPASFALASEGIGVFSFPHDTNLEVLRRIMEPAELERALPKIMVRRPEIRSGRISTLSYKPERRYVGRIDTPEGETAVLRFYAEREFERASLPWRKIKSRGPLRKAARIGAWKTRRVIGVEWIDGEVLPPLLASDRGVAAVSQVGAALASLQVQRDRIDAPLERDVLPAELAAAAQTLAFLVPDLAERAESLAAHLAERLAQRSAPDLLIHGDFYADQVLVDGDEVAVLDLDRVRPGDPSNDLGTFEAHLELACLEGKLGAAQRATCADALREGHADVAGAAAEGVDLHTAAALLKLTARPFRHRSDVWPERARALLDRAESRVGHAARAGKRNAAASLEDVVLVEDHLGASEDPRLPEVRRALQPATLRAVLEPVLAPGCTLRSIRTRRHRAGRRCLIEVGLHDPQGKPFELLAKIRSKGADTRTHDLCRALFDGDFGPSARDGIRVPEPIGLCPELGLWLQRRVPGVPATPLFAGAGGVALARRVAEAAHKLHAAGVSTSREHSVADELRILCEGFERVRASRPEWSARIERIRVACEALAATLPATEARGLHRDLHPDQILVDGDDCTLIDLDLYAMGDPAVDAGNFIAHLRELALRAQGDATVFQEHEGALRERFLELSGEARRRAVDTYTVLSFVRHIAISQRIPERHAATEVILEHSEALLDL